MDLDRFERTIAAQPMVTYRAGETILTAGSTSGRLLILTDGEVVVLKDSVEIARVAERGAIFGELSALLNQPHSADVRALRDSQFRVADAALADKNPDALFYIARILAKRILEANNSVVELKKEIQADRPSSGLSSMLARIERVLSVGGASFET